MLLLLLLLLLLFSINTKFHHEQKRQPNDQVADGINAYGVASHRHAPEIEQGLGEACGGKDVMVNFTPHLMPMSRGILEVSPNEPHGGVGEVFLGRVRYVTWRDRRGLVLLGGPNGFEHYIVFC